MQVVMRARRSAKFAEYLSTYAILEHIGIHPTALLEKRDAAVGIGLYVRDACDAGTTLLAVPSRRFCTNSVLSKVGVRCRFHDPWESTCASSRTAELTAASESRDLRDGIVSFLTGSAQWPELAWRLALEQHRSVSHLWGWLQSLPSTEEFKDQTESAERRCRVHHTLLLPYYLKGRQRINEEVASAYRQLRWGNVLPSFTTFEWAVEVLLSRGLTLPLAWPTDPSTTDVSANDMERSLLSQDDEKKEERGSSFPDHGTAEDGTLELGVVPFLDLVNAADDAGRIANAQIEVAASLEDLPPFFKEEMLSTSAAKGRDGAAELQAVLRTHYYLCLTLQRPLRASEEVIVECNTPVMTTGVLHSKEDQLVSRLLKYKY